VKKEQISFSGKHIILFVVLLLTCCGRAFGANRLTTAGSLSYVSSYIWRGQDLLPDNDSAIQPSITFTNADGVSLNLWGSFGFGGSDQVNHLDEWDYTLSYTGSISPALGWSIGHSYYTFPSVGGITESQESYFRLSFPKVPLSPAFTLYGDWGHGKGYYANLAGSKEASLNLGRTKVPISLAFSVGYTDGQWGFEPGFSDVNLSVGFPIGREGRLFTPSLNYTYVPEKGSIANGDVPPKINYDNEFWVGLKYDFNL
jgi:hypothetical protein